LTGSKKTFFVIAQKPQNSASVKFTPGDCADGGIDSGRTSADMTRAAARTLKSTKSSPKRADLTDDVIEIDPTYP